MVTSRKTFWLIATALFLLTSYFDVHPIAVVATDVNPLGSWYNLNYAGIEASGSVTLNGIALDAQGNGWINALIYTQQATWTHPFTAVLTPLENGRMNISAGSKFPKVEIHDVAVSSNGKEGWAVGYNWNIEHKPWEAEGKSAIIHYTNGAWSLLEDALVVQPNQDYVDVVINQEGSEGWIVGKGIGNYGSLLHLHNGKWHDATQTLPRNTMFTRIAADSALNYVWAAGIVIGNSDAALYRWNGQSWTSVSKPLGHYIVEAIAADAHGDGWLSLLKEYNYSEAAHLVRFHQDGSWQAYDEPAFTNRPITAIAVDDNGTGWAMGYKVGVGRDEPPTVVYRLKGNEYYGWLRAISRGDYNQQEYGISGVPSAIVLAPNNKAWAVSFNGELFGFGKLPFAMPVLASNYYDGQQFENGFLLDAALVSYWHDHNGERQFGPPITPLLIETLEDGKTYFVQYTERARLQFYDSQNVTAPTVQLGLLGSELSEERRAEAAFRRAKQQQNAAYFSETGHNLAGVFGQYWQEHDGLGILGYPISEEFVENSSVDGAVYIIQYFERSRLRLRTTTRINKAAVIVDNLGTEFYQHTYRQKAPCCLINFVLY